MIQICLISVEMSFDRIKPIKSKSNKLIQSLSSFLIRDTLDCECSCKYSANKY